MYHSVSASPGKAVSPSAGNGNGSMPPPPPTKPIQKPAPKMGWKYYSACALVITLLFLVLSSHDAYKILDSILEPLGVDAAGITGCSKGSGLVIMALIFYASTCLVLKQGYCMTK